MKAKRLVALFLIILLQTTIALIIGGSILMGRSGDKVLPGVSSGGIELGGLSPAEAEMSLKEKYGPGENGEIVIVAGDRQWTIPFKSIGATYDYRGAVKKAYDVGRWGPLPLRISELLGNRAANTDIPLPLKFDQEALKKELEKINAQYSAQPRNARLVLEEENKVTLVPGRDGHEMDLSGTIARISALRAGLDLKVDAASSIILPGIKDEDLSGLTDVLGECVTRFETGSTGRANNISLATGKIDGVLVNPGEIFSFNSALGSVDQKNGYLKAPVIANNWLVDDYGGGVCQVSTTLYGAVLLSGLEIVERHPHSKPVKYVPPGLDVTVSEGLKDFIFKNNLDSKVYVFSATGPEDGYVRVVIIGKKKNNTVYRVESEVKTVTPGIVLRGSPGLSKGESVVVNEGSPGFEAWIFRVSVSESGEESKELMSQDYYPPEPKILNVGM